MVGLEDGEEGFREGGCGLGLAGVLSAYEFIDELGILLHFKI